jgi:hypothetical protein
MAALGHGDYLGGGAADRNDFSGRLGRG